MAGWNWNDIKDKAKEAFTQASDIFDQAKVMAQGAWDEAQLSFWKNQIGEEDTAQTMTILADASTLYAELEKLVTDVIENPAKHGVNDGEFMAEVEERKTKRPLKSPFKQQRSARNCRLAANDLITSGKDAPVYREIKALSASVESLYKGLPDSYVEKITEWQQTTTDVSARANDLGERVLTQGKEGIAAIRSKLDL